MPDAEKGRTECNHIDDESPSQDETAPIDDKDTVEQAMCFLLPEFTE